MRVLIVRLGSMGDVLHALPAVAALRAAHPDIEIGWAIERRWTPFLSSKKTEGCPTLTDFGRVGNQESETRSPQQPLVDRVHIVDTLGWRRAPLSDATWSDIRDTFRDIRAQRYDLAIDFQGAIKSAVLAQLSGATSRIGFAQPREKPATMFYTHVVQPTGRHIVEHNFSLLSSAFPLCSSVPSVVNVFPRDPSADASIDSRVPHPDWGWKVGQHFAILNPGAGWPAKQWPAARYGQVARALRSDGILSLVNYGPGEEALAREVEQASDAAARPISCTLAELISLTRRAVLFIGGDTGPMHLANALGVPVVALFGPTDPARNGPYFGCPTLAGVARVGNSVVLRHPYSRTTTTHSSTPDPGLLQITPEDVIDEIRKLLARQPTADRREPHP